MVLLCFTVLTVAGLGAGLAVAACLLAPRASLEGWLGSQAELNFMVTV